MHYHAVEPPLDPSTTTYAGVALVTLGTVLTLSVVLLACSFFRKIRSGTNDSSAQTAPGIYVAESYANPAFLELPFDGSCTSSADIPYDFPVSTTVSVHVHPHQTTSTLSACATDLSPKSVVVTATGPTPYQAEPKYCVQSNLHTDAVQDEAISAIGYRENRTLDETEGGSRENSQRSEEEVSSDLVYSNEGAKEESFKKPKPMGDISKSSENLPSECRSSGISTTPQHENGDAIEGSASIIENNNVKCEYLGIAQGSGDGYNRNAGKQSVRYHGNDGRVNRIDMSRENTETTSSKRVRISLESLNAPRENGITQQQRKKPKMSPDGGLESEGQAGQSMGKNRVRRKGSRSSFSRVKKPVFHPRKKRSNKKPPKVESSAEVVIQNPFVS